MVMGPIKIKLIDCKSLSIFLFALYIVIDSESFSCLLAMDIVIGLRRLAVLFARGSVMGKGSFTNDLCNRLFNRLKSICMLLKVPQRRRNMAKWQCNRQSDVPGLVRSARFPVGLFGALFCNVIFFVLLVENEEEISMRTVTIHTERALKPIRS